MSDDGYMFGIGRDEFGGSLDKCVRTFAGDRHKERNAKVAGKAWGMLHIVAMAAVLFVFLLTTTSTADEAPSWEWTKENPKPSWWDWGEKYWPSKPVHGGYYRTAALRYIGLMNPNHWPVNDWTAMTYFYGRLVHGDGEYKPTVPWQAKSWRYVDPVTVVMSLRKGIKFHDGSSFNAASMKYQLDWIMDKKNGCWTRSWIEPIKSIEVADEYTLKFHFKRPWAAFLGYMQTVPGFPISAEALKKETALKEEGKLAKKIKAAEKKLAKAKRKAEKAKTGKARSKVAKEQKKLAKLKREHRKVAKLAEGAVSVDVHPVGTGWYMFESASPGNYLKVKRNPNWWFGQSIGRPEMPYFDGIKITIIPDPSIQLANLRANKIDAMGVDKSQYGLVKRDRNLHVTVVPQNHVFGFTFNHTSAPMKDIRVRKAVSHAIDRRALIVGTQFGLARLASGMYPEDHWAHNPDLKPVSYDPELSRRLLAEAGYADGLTLRGSFGSDPIAQSIATAAKGMFAKVGINWDVRFLDPAAINDSMKNLDYDLMGLYWTYIWDPDSIATGYYHPDGGFNFGKSMNQKAVELIMAGRKEIDTAKRQKIYWAFEKEVYDNYEDAWIWWDMSVVAYNKNVQGGNINYKMYQVGRDGYYFSHPAWFKNGKP
ncbi:MAG: ABC transporter substrate-binding protein [Proteobacteria bacterium]|nr:ABC transporter substrate-binding protein [Pseudomonadota bacterium]